MSNDEYNKKLKNYISETFSILDQNGTREDHTRYENIKFEIRQFSITFSKNSSSSLKSEIEILERAKGFRKIRLKLI